MFDYKKAWESLEQKLTAVSDNFVREQNSSDISNKDYVRVGGVVTGLLLSKQYMFDILMDQLK